MIVSFLIKTNKFLSIFFDHNLIKFVLIEFPENYDFYKDLKDDNEDESISRYPIRKSGNIPKTNCIKCSYEKGYYHFFEDLRTCISEETKFYWEKVFQKAIYLDKTVDETKRIMPLSLCKLTQGRN